MTNYAPNIVHLVDPSILVPHPINRKPNPKHVKELAVSILAAGQVTPALARPHPEKEGHLELAAGLCRTKACEQAGVNVKVIVQDMTDKEIHEVVLLENLQREDLDPYEEAEKLQLAMDTGIDVREMANSLGKTAKWLKTRLLLGKITPKIRNLVRGVWPIEAAEVLGDLPVDTQAAAYEYYEHDTPTNAKEVLAWVNQSATPIDGLAFLNDPATANEETGCKDGCKSSSEDMLFKLETGCKSCTNRDCLRTRFAKHVALQLQNLLNDYPTRVYLASRLSSLLVNYKIGVDPSSGRVKGVHVFSDWMPMKTLGKTTTKITDKTCFYLTRDEDSEYKLSLKMFIPHAKEESKGKASAAGSSSEDLQGQRPNRIDLLKGKRFIALLEKVVATLQEFTFPPNLNNLIAAFGTVTSYPRDSYRGDRWAMHREGVFSDGMPGGKEKMQGKDLVVEMVRGQMLNRLDHKFNPTQAARDKALVEEVENVGQWMRMDLDALRKQIAEELPPPKSWADEVDLYTLEPKS